MALNRDLWSPTFHPPITANGDSEVGLLGQPVPAQVGDNAAGTGCMNQ